MLLSAEQQGAMVFHILEHGFHQPLVNGKADRDKIEDQIIVGLYNKEIPPCDQDDVVWMCDLVDTMIMDYGENK
tara:strand:+ start:85 stop:306 length:222 start_codon:yes stop_codon:yes gene_type:complete